jgi:hypothetical protein
MPRLVAPCEIQTELVNDGQMLKEEREENRSGNLLGHFEPLMFSPQRL